jgi:hypothetical protein
MATWREFATAEPDFAARVRQLFTRQKHLTMATLRRDGAPRISGTEVEFSDEHLSLGMMPRSLKALDLLRDPRVALHSPSLDPPAKDESTWPGEAKIAGRAREVADDTLPPGSHRFQVDITEVALTEVGTPADHLVIQSWHPDRGLELRKRY